MFEKHDIVYFQWKGVEYKGKVFMLHSSKERFLVRFENKLTEDLKTYGRYTIEFDQEGKLIKQPKEGICLTKDSVSAELNLLLEKVGTKVLVLRDNGTETEGVITRVTTKCVNVTYDENNWYFLPNGEWDGELRNDKVIKVLSSPDEPVINEGDMDKIDFEVGDNVDNLTLWERKKRIPLISTSALNTLTDNFKQNKEENKMRRTVTVELFDDDNGLEVQDSLVARFENVVTEDNDNVTIQEVIMENDIKDILDTHNIKREGTVDLSILERTGNTVMLRPVKLKDLRWVVR